MNGEKIKRGFPLPVLEEEELEEKKFWACIRRLKLENYCIKR
ncbi:hypothetical protein AAZX31_20G136300 [Glycine max]